MSDVVWGIDFGSKLAGTTVIASLDGASVTLKFSEKKKDADIFIEHCFQDYSIAGKKPKIIGIDAPLSLPKVYRQFLSSHRTSFELSTCSHQYNEDSISAESENALEAHIDIHMIKKEQDFFYRECDRQLQAMSPMFLGGLTARAMRICSILEEHHALVIEVYPSALVTEIALQREYYKADLEKFYRSLERAFAHTLKTAQLPAFTDLQGSWHAIDSMLALLSAIRFQKRECLLVGDKEEGVISV